MISAARALHTSTALRATFTDMKANTPSSVGLVRGDGVLERGAVVEDGKASRSQEK